MTTTLSCGQCGAPLRPEQGWCTLCFTSVEPAFDPLTAPLEQVVGRGDQPAHPTVELPATPEAVHEVFNPPPALRPPSPAPTADTAETAVSEEAIAPLSDVDVMLSMLAAEHRQSEPVAGLAERLGDKSTRIAVMFGGMLLIGVVGFLLLTVLGAIF